MVIVLIMRMPLVLWPAIAITGSLVGGIGFGLFAPLLATFEVVGKDAKEKCFNCFAVIEVPSSLLVIPLALAIDVLLITAIALWKSPLMLFIGCQRLLQDLFSREGPFLETVCVPFAGLTIILWPLAVGVAVIGAFLSSFVLALYSGIIVHQEDSLRMGLMYIVAVISLFDEYTNDMLYLREGS